MLKDEAGGKQITEFVGLRAKLYVYKKSEREEEKRCKGIKKEVIEKSITFNDYKNCLFTKVPQMREMSVIRNHLYQMYAETVNKVALLGNYDKRIVREDGIHTYAYGHYATLSSEDRSESRDEGESIESEV